MSERSLSIENHNPIDVYGVNDRNIGLISKVYPKLKFIARGDIVKVLGDENEIDRFEIKFRLMLMHLERFNKLTEDDIVLITDDNDHNGFENKTEGEDFILYGRNGMPVRARTPNQMLMLKRSSKSSLVFAIGPAGTGKTYTAIAIAVKALKNKEVKRIILTRPAVEAGENLGFLPGDLREKLDPYMQPLYDALRDMIHPQKLLNYLEDGTVEVAPLAFMRGRTLDNAFVILDEAQNATISQIKMFLTRMGKTAKFIVTGDITQIDLPRNQSSGLAHSEKILKNIEGIDFIYLNDKDVMRHKLVNSILSAYQKDYEQSL